MADTFKPTTTRPGGPVTGYKGSQAGKAQAEDRTYRNQIGIGERGEYAKEPGLDTEEKAKAFLTKKGRIKKGISDIPAKPLTTKP